MEDSKSRKTPSMVPPVIPEYHAAMTFPEMMPDAVDLDNEIQGMLSWSAMAAISADASTMPPSCAQNWLSMHLRYAVS